MVRRAVGSEFMGNAYVFPGGSVDEADCGEDAARAVRWEGDEDERPWRAAALRELFEEAGLALTDPKGLDVPSDGSVYETVPALGGRLDGHLLHWVSRWITPEGLPRRFDTRFYVAEVTAEAASVADNVEVFDDTWVVPADALQLASDGTWDVPFPTLRHLEMLARHDTIGEVIAAAATTEIQCVLPRIVMSDNGEYTVRVPGDPGYEHEVAT
jgi:8-oxo-dGTP pyrophosphatase MutT (NUDIX family)